MSLIKYDLIMSEDEVEDSSKDMQVVVQHANKKLNTYIDIIRKTAEDGIVDGIIHEHLKVYLASAEKLKSFMKDTNLEEIQTECKKFPKDFDKADDILF